MRFSTGAGGFAAAMTLLVAATFYPTPSLAWQVDPAIPAQPAATVPAPAVAQTPITLPAVPAPVVSADQAQAHLQLLPVSPPPSPAKMALAQDATVDQAEENCLATAVYFEAKGEPMRGQRAVAEVILNRMRSGRFPSSACGVVKQRGQFSFVRAGRLPAVPRDCAAWHTAVAVARAALEGSGERVVSNALFFHARGVTAGWRAVRVAQIGNQVFYR
jgi:hypothetical protein